MHDEITKKCEKTDIYYLTTSTLNNCDLNNRDFFMNHNIFDPHYQESDLTVKTVVGLERISEAFKVLLREKAKQLGLSPIQIQILLFVSSHKEQLCNVSFLASEFNVTKPTISDAVKSLNVKGLISKQHSDKDSRSFTIKLSQSG